MRLYGVIVVSCLIMVTITHAGGAPLKGEWTVSSPDSRVTFTVGWTDPAAAEKEGSTLFYRVEIGSLQDRTPVVLDSPLGLTLSNIDLSSRLVLERKGGITPVHDQYPMLYGKRSQCEAKGNQLSLWFRNPAGDQLELEARAYTDGVAFRYRVHPRAGSAGMSSTLESEQTGFHLPQDARVWCAPADKATMYAPAYETFYESEIPAGTPAPLGKGWSFPLLYRNGSSSVWALITEANVGTNFCGTRLSSTAVDNTYSIALPILEEGNGTGEVKPASTLPWEMPWRVIIAGPSLATIVESTLVTDVSDPSTVKDVSWIKPGRVAWSWWSDNPSPKHANAQRKFIDLAAEMGWEYVLVDANWTIMDQGNLREVLDYAKTKNVGVLLWYNSGGPHNLVSEKPRDCFTYGKVREFEMDLLKQWGVKGVKVDFFQSDKQDVIGLYHGILRDAASRHIMVNFHGCTLPRGWERTYPHLMSMEAVRGAECYIFDETYPEKAPVQNTILPFTRNAVGPMDYTPVTLSNHQYPHRTTYAHELALSVLFTSGWLHLADRAEAYRALPEVPKNFLKQVPVTWDETRFIEGYPGRYAVVARRKGTIWYLAGINGQKQSQEIVIKSGPWSGVAKACTLIEDGTDGKSFRSQKAGFSAEKPVTVSLLPNGGFAALLTP